MYAGWSELETDSCRGTLEHVGGPSRSRGVVWEAWGDQQLLTKLAPDYRQGRHWEGGPEAVTKIDVRHVRFGRIEGSEAKNLGRRPGRTQGDGEGRGLARSGQGTTRMSHPASVLYPISRKPLLKRGEESAGMEMSCIEREWRWLALAGGVEVCVAAKCQKRE